jgi:hypothetical protein
VTTTFKMRLTRGKRYFMRPPPAGGFGRTFLVEVPEFCLTGDFPAHCGYGTPGGWDMEPLHLAAIDKIAAAWGVDRETLLNHAHRPGFAGFGFVPEDGSVWVDLYLKTTEYDLGASSPFSDWARVLRYDACNSAKDVFLRLTFDAFTHEAIAKFKRGDCFVTSDIELTVAARTHKWLGDDAD